MSRAPRSPKLLIFLTIFVDLLGFGIVIPILPIIAEEFVGGDHYLEAGVATALLMGSYSLLQFMFSRFWGRLSDRHGRRPILLLSLFGSTLAYLLFAVSRSYELLLFSRIFAGICGANITAAQAYIADVTSREQRTAGMGLVGMAFGLGFAFGPVLGAVSAWGWELGFGAGNVHMGPGLLAAAICGVNFLWAVVALPESLPRALRGPRAGARRFASWAELREILASPLIGVLILLFFFVTVAFANVEISFGLFAKTELGLHAKHIYALFVAVGLTMAVVQGGLVKRLAPRLGETNLIVAGIAILALGLLAMPFSRSWAELLGAAVVLAIGQGLCNPCLLALISRNYHASGQGNVLGANQSMSALARIVGPAIAGPLFDVNVRFPFWAGTLIMAGCLWVAFGVRRRVAATPVFTEPHPADPPLTPLPSAETTPPRN